ncbi:transporter substrate-binding domain-containing protein [Marinomonas sp. A79]|uniref:Transporter substrate-binding domain-containing protein n=1 Tax=Marinomonas vulgaris TaxID=2823372 RepID=A0ABS5H6P4_9GAMM|nr:transporter substrate-binding domain-containing protein [Marinomonas vulgaris]MBR7887382.1 transporter substrate-binding domain-containing protein [Marinomonas vulgaris]
MRLQISLLCCVLAAISFNAHAVTDDEEPSESQCRTLIASGNSEYPPFLWRENKDSSQLEGVNRIIMDELARRTGIDIQLAHVGPWSRAQSEVENGRVDLMAGAFYTHIRSGYMDYFMPVMLQTSSVVWQNKRNPFPFHRKEDLKNRLGVTVINNSFGQDFDHYAERHLSILSVASVSQALRMLATGRVDYVLYEKNPASAYASLLGLSEDIVAVSPDISSEGLYLTMSKRSMCNNDQVKQKIAEALAAMSNEGFHERAMQLGIDAWEAHSRSLLN